MMRSNENDNRSAKIDVNTYSHLGTKESLASRTAWNVRQKIFQTLKRQVDFDSLSTVLDVGATADSRRQESNYFEMLYPYKNQITALSDQNAGWLEEAYPGLKFVLGDGRQLPFSDHSFDLVFSSAVIEHVGSYENQKKFVAECFRVARKHVFITTPNRWHFLEMHTAWPFLHWLPKMLHRRILKVWGLDFLANENNLNLLDTKTLKTMCGSLSIKYYDIFSVSFLGFPSNLLLYIHKQ